MKLNDIHNVSILWEHDELVLYAELLNEKEMKVGFGQKSGGIVKKTLQGITKFATKHPIATAAIASYAYDSIKQYNRNKRKTVTFFTKDVDEKNMYKDIVTQLMKSGKYKKERETFVDGGYLFVLKKF